MAMNVPTFQINLQPRRFMFPFSIKQVLIFITVWFVFLTCMFRGLRYLLFKLIDESADLPRVPTYQVSPVENDT